MKKFELKEYIREIILEELKIKAKPGDTITKESINEDKGTLKIEKGKDGKYYWEFTSNSGKVKKWPDGFSDKASAQKDFTSRMKYLKLLERVAKKPESEEESTKAEPTDAEIKKEEEKTFTALQKEITKIQQDMINTVEKWKNAAGNEKQELLDQLKNLTRQKKELDAKLDPSIDYGPSIDHDPSIDYEN